MAADPLSFTTCNLFNHNLPGLRMYRDPNGWSVAEYDAKTAWLGRALHDLVADVFGFQELWHADALTALLAQAGLSGSHVALAPPGHNGGRIACAAAVRTTMLAGEPRWIVDFPEKFRLSSRGDDAQTEAISVNIGSFSRPVLHFAIRPGGDAPEVQVYVCHLKSKLPAPVSREAWYRADVDGYRPHQEAIGAALSTIRRTAEAAAMRFILTEAMRDTDTPVVVLGDLNDGLGSNTLNIVTGQPTYLMGQSTGGSDTDLYTAQTLQAYRSTRDVYYTHLFQNQHESLDHILVSQEFYDNSRKRIWAFERMEVANDHLTRTDHKTHGSTDHGIVRATFQFRPARRG